MGRTTVSELVKVNNDLLGKSFLVAGTTMEVTILEIAYTDRGTEVWCAIQCSHGPRKTPPVRLMLSAREVEKHINAKHPRVQAWLSA